MLFPGLIFLLFYSEPSVDTKLGVNGRVFAFSGTSHIQWVLMGDWLGFLERPVRVSALRAATGAAELHDLPLASSCLEETGPVCTVLLPTEEPFQSQVLLGWALPRYCAVAYTHAGWAPDLLSPLPGEARCPSGPESSFFQGRGIASLNANVVHCPYFCGPGREGGCEGMKGLTSFWL